MVLRWRLSPACRPAWPLSDQQSTPNKNRELVRGAFQDPDRFSSGEIPMRFPTHAGESYASVTRGTPLCPTFGALLRNQNRTARLCGIHGILWVRNHDALQLGCSENVTWLLASLVRC